MIGNAAKLPINKQSSKTSPTPWPPFNDLRYEIDRLFDDFGGRNWLRPFRASAFDMPADGNLQWMTVPAVDFTDSDGFYELTVEAPGMSPADLEVTLKNGNIVVRGQKQENKEEKKKDYYLHERRFGSFERAFALPDGIDAQKIEASFANGVLSVRLPKTAEAQTPEKKLEIKAT